MRMNKEDRRAHLIKAAMIVARREGFAQVTTRAVAQEADISLGVVHYCFQDKEELLYEMAAHTINEIISTITNSVRTTVSRTESNSMTGLSITGLEEALYSDAIRVLNETSAKAENSPLIYEIISYPFHNSNKRFQDLITRYYNSLTQLFCNYLELIAQRTAVVWSMDLNQLASVIVDLMHGYLLRHLSLRTPQKPALASSADAMKVVEESLTLVIRTIVRNAEKRPVSLPLH